MGGKFVLHWLLILFLWTISLLMFNFANQSNALYHHKPNLSTYMYYLDSSTHFSELCSTSFRLLSHRTYYTHMSHIMYLLSRLTSRLMRVEHIALIALDHKINHIVFRLWAIDWMGDQRTQFERSIWIPKPPKHNCVTTKEIITHTIG